MIPAVPAVAAAAAVRDTGRRLWPLLALAAVVVFAVAVALVRAVTATGATTVALAAATSESTGPAGVACGPPLPGGDGDDAGGFTDPEQERVAAAIVAVAYRVWPDDPTLAARAAHIGVMTAMTESRLRALPGGHSSSVGPFQQLTAWGPFEDRRDPTRSATMFFTGGQAAGQPGLADIDAWWTLDPVDASHRVQRSAYPDRPRQFASAAASMIDRVGGGGAAADTAQAAVCVPAGDVTVTGPTGPCPESGSSAESGLTRDALAVLRCGASEFGITAFSGVGGRGNKSDHPSGRAVDLMIEDYADPAQVALGDRIAAYYVANADAFGVTYVIWRDMITSVDSRGWRPYVNPQCSTAAACSDNLRHLNHVHVSVEGTGGTL